MPEISKITLPSGNTYTIKDEVARQAIAGGVSYIIAWDGNSTPIAANIPMGVQVVYNGVTYTGSLSAETEGAGQHAQSGSFYLVKDINPSNNNDVFYEYIPVGTTGYKTWEMLGHTKVDLSNLGELAYKDNVKINKGSSVSVLGKNTTFNVINPTINVNETKTNVKATITNVGVEITGTKDCITSLGAPNTEDVLTSVTETKKKLVTTSIPNVTSVGSASDWSFSMGTGSDAETLIISGGNGSAPSLGAAITAATGGIADSGAGADVLVGVGTSKSSAVTGYNNVVKGTVASEISVTTQPSVSLSAQSSEESGTVNLVKSVSASASNGSVSANNNDNVGVAKYSDLSVSLE